jgi:hypothetical protein
MAETLMRLCRNTAKKKVRTVEETSGMFCEQLFLFHGHYNDQSNTQFITPELAFSRSDISLASDLAESWMETPVWRINSPES